MKHSAKYIALAALPLFAACEKMEVAQSSEGSGKRIVITSGFDVERTRSLVGPNDINSLPLTLYGISKGTNDASGTSFYNGFETKYPETDPTTSGKAVARMVSWEVYEKSSDPNTPDKKVEAPEWKSTLDYTFFAWLAKDKQDNTPATFFSGTDAFKFTEAGAGTDATGAPTPATLSIAAKKMPFDGSGFDFCYSDVVFREHNADAQQFDYSPVNLKLNHLFTAFALSASNNTGSKITIKSVKLYGLKDQKSAKIEFDKNETTTDGTTKVTKVTLNDAACTFSTTYKELLAVSGGTPVAVELASTESMANIIGTPSTDNNMPILMWPQTAEELAASNLSTSPSGTYLEIVYKKGTESDKTCYLELPSTSGSWEAGKCYSMDLAFFETTVTIKLSVEPWDFVEKSYDYSSVPALGSNGFKLSMTNTVAADSKDAVADATPVKITFALDTPKGATWLASVTNTDAFEIYTLDGTGAENPAYGIIENASTGLPATCTFYVKAKTSIDRSTVLTTKVHVTVRTVDGTYINVDDILDASDWTIILNPLS